MLDYGLEIQTIWIQVHYDSTKSSSDKAYTLAFLGNLGARVIDIPFAPLVFLRVST